MFACDFGSWFLSGGKKLRSQYDIQDSNFLVQSIGNSLYQMMTFSGRKSQSIFNILLLEMLIILNCIFFNSWSIVAYNKLQGLLIWESIVNVFEKL